MGVNRCLNAPSRGGVALAGAFALLALGGFSRLAAAAAPDAPASTPSVTAPGTPHPLLWPRPSAAPPMPQKVRGIVDDLLAHMSLEEKIAQMLQADISSVSASDLRRYKLGSVLAGGGSAPGGNVRASPAAWLDLADELTRASVADASPSHRPIPILFGIDAVHGDAKIRGATIFPHNIALGAAHDPELIERIGRATAEEVSTTGLDWTFSPTIAVAQDVRWGRTYESYSEDPALVASYAARMVRGLQGVPGTPSYFAAGRTLATAKHFLGDGGTVAGRDQGDNTASEDVLIRVHGAGYPAALGAGALVVMASYSSWHGVKMHANRGLLTDVLKGRMGFEGFVIGDWNAQEELPGCTKYDCPQMIRAGVDMVMAPDSWKLFYRNTLREVRSGLIPQARIDEAVRRILTVKAIAGLIDGPAPKERPLAGRFKLLGSPEHRALARRAVRESLVLLKNDHSLLPLNPRARVLVLGTAADSIADQSGGWTIDWQGDHNTNADFPGATSIFSGIRQAVEAAGGTATLSRDGRFAVRPDVVIAVYGESPYAEYEGDRETAAFVPQDPALLKQLKQVRALGIPVVSIFLSGRPLWVNPELEVSDAFIAAWLPGSEGEGISDVLFRGKNGKLRYEFRGRLAFSWPQSAMPVTFDAAGNAHGALFARGYGLSSADRVSIPHLDDDPRIPSDRGGPETLFQSGHVTAPWSVFVEDERAQLRMTLPHVVSPNGALEIEQRGNALWLSWSGTGSATAWIGGRPRDLREAARRGDALSIEYRIEHSPAGRVRIGLRCAATSQSSASRCGSEDAMIDLTSALSHAPPGSWQRLTLPLARFAHGGADLSNVEGQFTVESSGALGMSVADVRFVQAGAPRGSQRTLSHRVRISSRMPIA